MAKYNKLAGKHILVFGGTKGIGRGVVEASIESGARVTLVGSSQHSADEAVSQIKAAYLDAEVCGLACDLSRDSVEEDLEAVFQRAASGGSSSEINHVVTTAADSLTLGGLQDMTIDTIRRASHMRLVVPALLGKVAARHLPRTPESSLTITTGAIADKPAVGWSAIAYFASGLTGLARNLALELQPARVNAVEPGIVDTELWDATMTAEQKADMIRSLEEKLPLGRVGQVQDVTEAYLYLMKDKNCTGEVVKTRSGDHLV
ncbi:short-chain dehydrogenase [Xylariales sp. PMI_506]|nr:short-chain dehydrogenase [Xylariales sp. PMI_506]